MAAISEYADKIMAEVGKDITAGWMPATVSTFSELHDYVDANDYALEAAPFSEFGGTWDEYMEHLNVIEAEVDRRLRKESGDYVFVLVTADGTVKDRFSFYGPYDAGYELAQQRGALYDAPIIHIEVN
jgi:hypothetical protein